MTVKAEQTAGVEIRLPTIAVAIKPLPKVGEAFPNVDLKDADGKPIDIAAFRGRYVVLHGWAGWCSACPKDYDAIKKFRRELQDSKVAFVGLNLDSEPATARKLAGKYAFEWPQACLGEHATSAVAEQLRISEIPLYVVVGPDGVLAFRGGDWPSVETFVRDRLRN